MQKNKKVKISVDHPRYGCKPIPSGFKFSNEEIERSHWRYSSLKYFPETAIPANIDKQNYSIYPRSLYVDIEVECEECHMSFIFFAKEQQYWFETLGFWVDAHCTRCTDCRKKDQEIRFMQIHYQKLMDKHDRTPKETKQLKNIALELYQLGYIQDISKINSIH